MVKVLVIEDSPRLLRSLERGLAADGFTVDSASSGGDAMSRLSTNDYDVVVLDLGLPDMDGAEILRRLRACPAGPAVLILSARDTPADRVEGLQLGADDYLIKPFHFPELIARLQALARRRFDQRSPTFVLGRLRIDSPSRTVTANGEEVPLTMSEYTILECLLLRRGQVCSKEWLFDRLVNSDKDTTSNVVEVHVSSLRRKLREAGVEELIVTRRGHGYLVARAGEGEPDGD